MKYNTSLEPLIIPEYGRHIHSMANSLLTIKDRKKRNAQSNVLINIMGNLNTHLRDAEEYRHKLWDHLFIMCNNKLDIDAPYGQPSVEIKKMSRDRIHNTQGTVKYKHYGQIIIKLIKESVKLQNPKIKEHLFSIIAQQMKRSHLNWNQTNVQDYQIWSDLEKFAEQKLNLDHTKQIPVFQNQHNRKKTFYKRPHKKNYSKKQYEKL